MVSTRPEQTTLTPPPASEPLRLVGEVFKTYIITERGSELCLIDKHAAHERILFEQLARDYGSVPSQMLLVPVQVNLTAAEKQAVLQNLDLLTDAGIEAEDFGGSTVVVRAVPADVPVDDVEDMIVELAAKLADGGRDALREKTEWVLHSIACRAAIKAGDMMLSISPLMTLIAIVILPISMALISFVVKIYEAMEKRMWTVRT